MTKRSVIGGKVQRTPEYDLRTGLSDFVPAAEEATGRFKAGLYVDGARTHARDKALLVVLGVDGDVPFAQAMVNSGLYASGGMFDRSGRTTARFASKPANDNTRAAIAA